MSTIKADIRLAESFHFKVIRGVNDGGDDTIGNGGSVPVFNPLIPMPLPNLKIKGLPQEGHVYFQYPPKITAHGRKGNWTEEDSSSNQPIVTYKSSDPVNISLSFSYILTNQPGANASRIKVWNYEAIKKQLTVLRGYFEVMVNFRAGKGAGQTGGGGGPNPLLIECNFWRIGGKDKVTARMKSVDVKYSDTMIMPQTYVNDDSNIEFPEDAFPYRTDVNVELSLITREVNPVPRNMTEFLPQDWY